MNRLKYYVDRRLKVLGITRSELVIKIGYKNMNKGHRQLEYYLTSALDDDMTKKLAQVLGEDDGKLEELTKQLTDHLKQQWIIKARREFKSSLRVKPRNHDLVRHATIFGRMGYALARTIKLPKGIRRLAEEKEFTTVINLCKEHRQKFPELWVDGGRAEYQRNYDEVYDVNEHYQITLRVSDDA